MEGAAVLRIIMHTESQSDVQAVETIYKWVKDTSIFYTSTLSGRKACEDAGVRYRFIRDLRVLVWEMARWKPKVYVDPSFLPVTFPRNGEKTVFVPKTLETPNSKKLLFYDYIFCPSFNYAEIIKNELEIDENKIIVLGYPKLETSTYVNQQVSESLVYKPDGNAGLRVATEIYKIASNNTANQVNLPSETSLGKVLK